MLSLVQTNSHLIEHMIKKCKVFGPMKLWQQPLKTSSSYGLRRPSRTTRKRCGPCLSRMIPGNAEMSQRLQWLLLIFICARRLEDRARHKKQECLRTFKSSCNAINDRSFTRAHYISYQPLPCKGSATCVAIIDRFDLILPARNSVQATVAIHGANCSEMRLVIFELIESQKGNFFKVYTTSKNVMYTQPCT